MQCSKKSNKGLVGHVQKNASFTNENTIDGVTEHCNFGENVGLQDVDEMVDGEEEDEDESEMVNSDIDNNIDNNNYGEEEEVEDQSDFGDNYERVIFGSMGDI